MAQTPVVLLVAFQWQKLDGMVQAFYEVNVEQLWVESTDTQMLSVLRTQNKV